MGEDRDRFWWLSFVRYARRWLDNGGANMLWNVNGVWVFVGGGAIAQQSLDERT
jgi:hypothetical protein